MEFMPQHRAPIDVFFHPRNVAVIGDTAWAMAPAPDIRAANRAIPFFGLLMGFSTIGGGRPGAERSGGADGRIELGTSR
jgi:hypothetical protein